MVQITKKKKAIGHCFKRIKLLNINPTTFKLNIRTKVIKLIETLEGLLLKFFTQLKKKNAVDISQERKAKIIKKKN